MNELCHILFFSSITERKTAMRALDGSNIPYMIKQTKPRLFIQEEYQKEAMNVLEKAGLSLVSARFDPALTNRRDVVHLKQTLLTRGKKAIEEFTGEPVTAIDRNSLCDDLDAAICRMPKNTLSRYLQEYQCDINQTGAWYHYTGQKDSRNEPWYNIEAYKAGSQMAPTGSIHILHPKMDMLCRVSDNPKLPGFLITCKDAEAKTREFHIWLDQDKTNLLVCTSRETSKHILPSNQINVIYPVPFQDDEPEKTVRHDGPISRKDFREYAKTLLTEGTYVCPACLNRKLLFTTDDRHRYYILECASCHMGLRDTLFMNIHMRWNTRRSKDPELNRRTWNIDCSFWNAEEERTEYVEPCSVCPYSMGQISCQENPCPDCQGEDYATFRQWMKERKT